MIKSRKIRRSVAVAATAAGAIVVSQIAPVMVASNLLFF